MEEYSFLMDKDILIVEDEPFFARMCAKTLGKDGRSIRVATDGKEALAMIHEKTPDLLVLDLLLPTMDGFSVLEFLKSHPHSFPIIILSNLGTESQPALSEKLGAAAFCVKSDTSLAEIEKIVEKCLSESTVKETAAIP